MSNDPQPPPWPPPQQWPDMPASPPPGQPLPMPGWPTPNRSGGDQVFLPAVFLLVFAVLNLLGSFFPLMTGVMAASGNPFIMEVLEHQARASNAPYTTEELAHLAAVFYLSIGIPELIFALITIIGAVCMLMLRGYVMAVIASVLMAIPVVSLMACACLAGTGIGIWCLYTLFLPEVRAAFK